MPGLSVGYYELPRFEPLLQNRAVVVPPIERLVAGDDGHTARAFGAAKLYFECGPRDLLDRGRPLDLRALHEFKDVIGFARDALPGRISVKKLHFLKMHSLDAAHVGASQAIASAPDQRRERVFGRARKKVRPAKKVDSKRSQENVALAFAATVDPHFSPHWVIHQNVMPLRPVKDARRLAVLQGALPAERHAMPDEKPPFGWLLVASRWFRASAERLVRRGGLPASQYAGAFSPPRGFVKG